MSEQQLGKKMGEEESLYLFLEAYKNVTGEVFITLTNSERPDFVCQRSDQTAVGVELTKVMRDPESALWDCILHRQDFRKVTDATDAIWTSVERKSQKIQAGNWQCPDNTILVLQMMDCPLRGLHRYLEDSYSPDDYAGMGFSEIWVADYSEVDSYGVIELFGLYPKRWWGYHERWCGKPYG